METNLRKENKSYFGGFCLPCLLVFLAMTSLFAYQEEKPKKVVSEEIRAIMKEWFELSRLSPEGRIPLEKQIVLAWKMVALDTSDQNPRAYRFLGDLYGRLGKADSAEIAFVLGHKKFPKDAYFHRMLGYFYSHTARDTAAIGEYYHLINQGSVATLATTAGWVSFL